MSRRSPSARGIEVMECSWIGIVDDGSGYFDNFPPPGIVVLIYVGDVMTAGVWQGEPYGGWDIYKPAGMSLPNAPVMSWLHVSDKQW
jgi:hypothetical protein